MMAYEIQILYGRDEIHKYLSNIELSITEKDINLKEYSFENKVEIDAFLRGVDAAIGWTEFYITKTDFNLNEAGNSILTRKDFMDFFRNDDLLMLLTIDDRIEIFSSILLGDGDFTKELFDQIFSDYGVTQLKVVERSQNK